MIKHIKIITIFTLFVLSVFAMDEPKTWFFSGDFKARINAGELDRTLECNNINDNSLVQKLTLLGYDNRYVRLSFKLKAKDFLDETSRRKLDQLAPFSAKMKELTYDLGDSISFVSRENTGLALLEFLYSLKQVPDFVVDRFLSDAAWRDFRPHCPNICEVEIARYPFTKNTIMKIYLDGPNQEQNALKISNILKISEIPLIENTHLQVYKFSKGSMAKTEISLLPIIHKDKDLYLRAVDLVLATDGIELRGEADEIKSEINRLADGSFFIPKALEPDITPKINIDKWRCKESYFDTIGRVNGDCDHQFSHCDYRNKSYCRFCDCPQ